MEACGRAGQPEAAERAHAEHFAPLLDTRAAQVARAAQVEQDEHSKQLEHGGLEEIAVQGAQGRQGAATKAEDRQGEQQLSALAREDYRAAAASLNAVIGAYGRKGDVSAAEAAFDRAVVSVAS